MITLEPEHVRRWLERMHPTDEAGISQDHTHCPLATYLSEVSGGHEARVGNWDYSVGGEGGDLPPWARSFVERIDDYGDDCGQIGEARVPATVALDLLDRALAHPDDDPEDEGEDEEEDEE